ncbi:MAG: DUF3109 family protein [Chlorobium sp.]|nr:DUF3109 family protein [Chlorobium sp.]MCW8819050.1 DUF3109 family protein [Ignavibacteriaceae bacterium]
MLAVGEVLIDDGLASRMFCCDIMHCKGACCVEGELGAPVRQEEVAVLEKEAQKLNRHLSEKQRRYIRQNGLFEYYRGETYTQTMEGRECVFAYSSGGVTLCSIEEHKPLSCKLFPVRIKKKFGLDYLVVERHSMCEQAERNGLEKQMPVVDFLGDALIERYGLSWYTRLKDLLANSPIHYARH